MECNTTDMIITCSKCKIKNYFCANILKTKDEEITLLRDISQQLHKKIKYLENKLHAEHEWEEFHSEVCKNKFTQTWISEEEDASESEDKDNYTFTMAPLSPYASIQHDEEKTSKSYRQAFENILEITKCAVCLDTLTPPVIQCINGHGICDSCLNGISNNKCPTCRQNLSPYKSVLLDQIVVNLPNECKFKDCFIFFKAEDDHEKWCGFKPTDCKLCDWSGRGKDILGHIKIMHPEVIIYDRKNNYCLWELEPNCNSCIFSPLLAYGQFFWEETRYQATEKLFVKKYILIPNGKFDCNLQIKLRFENENNKSVFIKCTRSELFLDECDNKNSVTIHLLTLQDFVEETTTLLHGVSITKVR